MQFRKLSLLVGLLAILGIFAPATTAAADPGVTPGASAATSGESGATASEFSPEGSDFAVASCYGSAKNYTTNSLYYVGSATQPLVATSNCNDINVKPDYDIMVRACLYYSSLGYYKCNDYRNVYAGQWGLAATNVIDGTKFYLEFPRQSRGKVAY